MRGGLADQREILSLTHAFLSMGWCRQLAETEMGEWQVCHWPQAVRWSTFGALTEALWEWQFLNGRTREERFRLGPGLLSLLEAVVGEDLGRFDLQTCQHQAEALAAVEAAVSRLEAEEDDL